ncbi:tetratricopeptide repeat protein 9C-like isoform X1 [Centruroides sculpturatus]|uniref:tetratricopeptide repeat protein 9C-like isoform X1 n=2 Tax=Centruroides sculpturatus TaxID=218467 RepID=UPI000C6DAA82|nr:tetratricopeptide repeat protein 9C-like isoform X1 [Centruroides sculpturatus]XP_023231507.1 tetratricopeptide repeat protein 9C-like isoform X1 [Centruroides sculpturatus]XP_023231508.1 tetratricopeptide repeat protein 9C-like isoform X1 [Centruroides sculpturatus]XP_023231509.1 tetratricopeptide repeat protein 9C-like isoform X1 [Centruroides sculpturatus]XP_023231510.1 tetratricopeptide repeat protein 9C-like isoform X1 [Centruroides sculpturatus]
MNIEITENPIKQQISVEEKLQTAKKFKEEGNNLYKSKNYKMAMGKYHRALLYVKGIEEHHQKNNLPSMFYQGNLRQNNTKSLSKNIQEEVKILKADCYNNLAASLLHQRNVKYEKVIQYCNEVITIKPNNVKALYRKGVSYYNLRDYDQCLETLQNAKQYLNTKDSNIEQYIKLSEEHLQRYKQKERECYKGMFDKLAEVDLSSSG